MVKLKGGAILVLPLLALSAPQQTPLSEPRLQPQASKLPTAESLSRTPWNLGSLANASFHQAYHPLYEVNEFLGALAHTYPANIVLECVGHSAEGREILAAAIARPQLRKNKPKDKKKPRFVIMGAQHARDWVATSTSLYLAHALVANASEARSVTSLLDLFDFYIVPMPNPDGYQYTWEQDRFWYKNLMPVNDNTQCRGIDMNRNWGFQWEPSSTPNEGPCAVWYPGTRAYQAPEVNALANYFLRIKRIRAFVDLRSYGQMMSTPFSYSCDVIPPDAEDMLEAAAGAAAALHSVHGTPMKTGMLCETLYSAPGNVLDWMYAERGVKYSYAVHLRDTGTYGFDLPARWIRPVGEETAEMVSYLTKFVAKEPSRKTKKKKA